MADFDPDTYMALPHAGMSLATSIMADLDRLSAELDERALSLVEANERAQRHCVEVREINARSRGLSYAAGDGPDIEVIAAKMCHVADKIAFVGEAIIGLARLDGTVQ